MRLSDKEKKQLVVYDTRKEQPSIWNLQAFVIVFLFIMLGTTINVYSVNNDNLTWVDNNGDFKLDSYDHSMINLDTPIQVLNNLSLNDVFDDGNILTLLPTNQYLQPTLFDTTYNNGVINVVMLTDTRQSFQQPFSWNFSNYNVLNDVLYYRFDVFFQSQTSAKTKLRVRDNAGSLYPSFDVIDDYVDYSYFRNYVTLNNLTYFQISFFENLLTNDEATFKDFYAINLTDLGIDNLTKAQMDAYYDLYVTLQENRIEAYKDLGNEPISQWQNLTQIISDIMDAVAGPISDTIDWIDKFMFGLFS